MGGYFSQWGLLEAKRFGSGRVKRFGVAFPTGRFPPGLAKKRFTLRFNEAPPSKEFQPEALRFLRIFRAKRFGLAAESRPAGFKPAKRFPPPSTLETKPLPQLVFLNGLFSFRWFSEALGHCGGCPNRSALLERPSRPNSLLSATNTEALRLQNSEKKQHLRLTGPKRFGLAGYGSASPQWPEALPGWAWRNDDLKAPGRAKRFGQANPTAKCFGSFKWPGTKCSPLSPWLGLSRPFLAKRFPGLLS